MRIRCPDRSNGECWAAVRRLPAQRREAGCYNANLAINNCIYFKYLFQPHYRKDYAAEILHRIDVRRCVHLQVELNADFAFQRNTYRLSITNGQVARFIYSRLHTTYRLNLKECTVHAFIRSQAVDGIEETGIGLIKVRIRDVDGRTVLARADVLQTLDGTIVGRIVARVVRIRSSVAERILWRFVQIGGESCVLRFAFCLCRSHLCFRF